MKFWLTIPSTLGILISRLTVVVFLGAAICGAARADAGNQSPTRASAQHCKQLASADFSTLQDAPTQIVSAEGVESHEKDPAYCRVQGYVWPQVGFELRLPSTWNGKFIEIGCGGDCGNLDWTFWCPLRRGYACIVSDMGHKGGGGLWAYHNLQAQIDFGYRATHVIALAGKAMVTHYYAKAPSRSMMMGCSTGGYQGVVEAQRFPWDFDGIVAISPDMESQAAHAMRNAWLLRNLVEPDGRPVFSDAELHLLHEAVLVQCDMTDGVKDGIVGDPVGCHFDPAALACGAGQTSGCLDSRHVTAARDVYSGPKTSDGESISTRGPFPGSELMWRGVDIEMAKPWPPSVFGYMFMSAAAGPGWKVSDFDFDRDYRRLGLAALYTDDNPDLRKFKAAGGKLILALGGHEVAEEPGAAIDYYETVERTMGGRAATREFFRLFVVPGMNHCSGGDGAYAIDYLTYLEDWVEKGRAPDVMIGAHVKDAYLVEKAKRESPPGDWAEHPEVDDVQLIYFGTLTFPFPLDPDVPIAFTRPVYPYPLRAMYTGRGDPDKAENFKPVGP